MTKSYHINELAISLILLATVKSLNCCYNIWWVSESLLLGNHSSQAEKESGAEGEEDIRDSQEPLRTIP